MHMISCKYLSFKSRGIVYCLNSLPFGVASAPWLRTLVSKEPVKVSRARGIALVHHMDDIPSAAQPTEKAK